MRNTKPVPSFKYFVMPNTKQDRATVSNDYREVKQFAKTMKVPPSTVYLAKEQTSSRRRSVLKSWIEQNATGKVSDAEETIQKIANDYGLPVDVVRDAYNKVGGGFENTLQWLQENYKG